MNPQIQFQAGTFRRFVAARNFALGNSGQTLSAGAEVEFDGTHYSYSGSAPAPMPQLRGAIKAGWLVLAENYDPDDMSASIPQPAGVRMRAADGGNPMNPQARHAVTTTDAEEREVGNVAAHAQQTRQANASARRHPQRAPSVSIEPQEGREVRTIKNPAFQPPIDLEKTSVTEAIRATDRAARIEPGQGLTREQMLAQMPEEEREAYLSEMEARRTGYIAQDDPQAVAERERNRKLLAQQGRLVDDQGPTVVGRVASSPKTAQKEGFNITNHVGGGTETVDLSGLDTPSENKVRVIESEGLKFTVTNGAGTAKPAAPAPAPAKSSDTRRILARSICPDFPDNYNFDDSVRKKIARLQADFDDRPDVIRAAASADRDEELRSRIVEEFPEAFT
jgi:hypothetical protein